jgi:tetratricopeptide (TPR) repeat protein
MPAATGTLDEAIGAPVSLPPFSLPTESSSAGAKHPADAYQHAWSLLEASAPLEAIAILDPAIEAEPTSASLRTLRAWAYFKSAQLHRAEADLVVLVEESPTDVWARFALGRVLERQSRYADALPHLRLAAVMSGDVEHEATLLRVERRLAEVRGSTDSLR